MHAPTGHPARRGRSARHGSSAGRSRRGSARGRHERRGDQRQRGGLVLGHVLAAAVRQHDGRDEEPLWRAVPAELVGERRERRVQQLDVGVEDDRDRTGRPSRRRRSRRRRSRRCRARSSSAPWRRATSMLPSLEPLSTTTSSAPGRCRFADASSVSSSARGVVRDRDERQAGARCRARPPAGGARPARRSARGPARGRSAPRRGRAHRRRARASARAPRAGRARPGRRPRAGRGGRSCRPRSRAGPPAAGATTGTPLASASAIAIPNGSRSAVCSRTRARRERRPPAPRRRRARRGRRGPRGRRGRSAPRPAARRRRRARRRPGAASYPARARRPRAPGPAVSSRRSRPSHRTPSRSLAGFGRKRSRSTPGGITSTARPSRRSSATARELTITASACLSARRSAAPITGPGHEVVVAGEPARARGAARESGRRGDRRPHSPGEEQRRLELAQEPPDLARVPGQARGRERRARARCRASRAAARAA